ncbi:hypothetical protein EC99P2_00051 [Enterococcus phage EC99P2]|nr:hypothetical protein EC99P2_00051 [Enterococcus phage EC99P2]
MLEYVLLEELRGEVKRQGITQQELAEETGITQSHISRFLNGTRGLSFFSFAALCGALGKSPSDFLNDEGKKLLTPEIV